MSDAYRQSGVDIDAGNHFVDLIKPFVQRTRRSGVLGNIGGFGGFFQLPSGLTEPVLVSGTDGVGTKLKLAIEMNKLDTIGQDLVAMCVNDIACSGATPLFFLDYFATGKLKPEAHSQIIKGIAEACAAVDCALIGGETAEMPDCYHGDDFDLAGFAVGVVERSRIIDGSSISIGNAIVGIASSGFHSNGYSLVRRIVREHHLHLHTPLPGDDLPLGERLLTPTTLYSPLLLRLRQEFSIHGIVHITGGGFWDNIPRILPSSVQAVISRSSWNQPLLFSRFQKLGKIDDEQMLRVFNCGVGMVLIVPQQSADEICLRISGHGHQAWRIGTIAARTPSDAAVSITS